MSVKIPTMPSNRRAQPEAEKRAELIRAARHLFLQDGYDATPINRIAQSAGVTPNTIYWYFRDKDELLLAVLEAVLLDGLADYQQQRTAPLADQLVWLVERLAQASGLMTTLHNRIRVSPVLNAWHDRFHSLLEHLLQTQLPAPLPANVRDAEIRIISFSLEGLVSHLIPAVAVRDTCAALAARCLALTQP